METTATASGFWKLRERVLLRRLLLPVSMIGLGVVVLASIAAVVAGFIAGMLEEV